MNRCFVVAAAFVIAMVVAGFILAGFWDANGGLDLPGMSAFWALPRPLRILLEIVVGVPMAFGAALYLITQLLEFLWLVSWPFRKIARAVRGQAA